MQMKVTSQHCDQMMSLKIAVLDWVPLKSNQCKRRYIKFGVRERDCRKFLRNGLRIFLLSPSTSNLKMSLAIFLQQNMMLKIRCIWSINYWGEWTNVPEYCLSQDLHNAVLTGSIIVTKNSVWITHMYYFNKHSI